SRTPLLNAILPVYVTACAAFYAAARIYRRAGIGAERRIVQTLEASALVIAAAGLNFEVRHLATGGDLGAVGFGLAELSADVIAWLGLGFGLAVRFGAKPRFVLFWGEAILALLAAGAALFGLALFDNPWWGEEIVRIGGPPLFDVLLASYGIPAALFA